MKRKMICFDMDGTIADLYGVQDWLEYLNNENETPYLIAKPMCNMCELQEILLQLMLQDWEVRVISWLAKESTKEYKEKVKQAKLEWLDMWGFPYNKAHLVRYGATKADSVRNSTEYAILIDDNAKVRQGWHLGETVDPTQQDIIEFLKNLLDRG